LFGGSTPHPFPLDRSGNRRTRGPFTLQGVRGFFFPSAASILEVVKFVTDSTFIQALDQLLRQAVGMPMGTNCAVFLANAYLFMYEFRFSRHMIQSARIAQLREFLFTSRFLDDLFSAGNTLFESMRYQIYPQQYLRLTASEAQPSRSVSFLDLQIFNNGDGTLSHRLYDKRREDRFSGIPLVRFPDIRSIMPLRGKIGVIVSQFYRFRTVCLRRSDFLREMARLVAILLLNKQYPQGVVYHEVDRVFHIVPSLYGCRSARGLLNEFYAVLSGLLLVPQFRTSPI
jgi:hypothetical protein